MGRGGREAGSDAERLRPVRSRRGPPRYWTDERILDALRRFTQDRTTWPTNAEFHGAGQGALRAAIRDHGGMRHWARLAGLALRPAQDRRTRTEEEIVALARTVIAELGYLPNEKELRARGQTKLASWVGGEGGAAAFRARHRI